MEDKLILVYYISINHINVDDIPEYMKGVMNRIGATSITENSEVIAIPVYGETKIECINPKYITDSGLIKQHERTMSKLHEKLKNQMEQLNVKVNE